MTSQSENDDVSEAFDIVKTSQVNFDEETLTELDEDELTNFEQMTETNLERSPIRRLNIIGGPHSAFARLFPEKYQKEQEQQQRSKSSDIHRETSDDELDEEYNQEKTRKSRRVRFDNNTEENLLKNRTKSESALQQIPLNHDPDPEIIYRDNPEKFVYTQRVAIRYLKPPTPPPPGPIVIREIQSTPPEEPPPFIVSSTPPIPPQTPSPLIVREQPPPPPEQLPKKIITKTLPPPPSTPRRVIIKRHPPLPAKPRPVIIEKWLPYKSPGERPILYERAKTTEQTRTQQRNLILQYEPAQVQIKQKVQNFGCFRVDPELYRAQHGTSLRRTESIRRVLKDIGCDPDLITSTGYQTCFPTTQNLQTNHPSSHYDYPRQSTTCFTDDQLDTLIGTAVFNSRKQESHYDVPRSDHYHPTNLVSMV